MGKMWRTFRARSSCGSKPFKTKPIFWLAAIWLSLSAPSAVSGALVSGSYSGPATWVYLDKFCFRSRKDQPGMLKGTIAFPVDSPPPVLMAYFKASDEDELDTEWATWNSVYTGGLTCTEKYNRCQDGGKVIRLLDSFSKGRTLSKPATQEMVLYPGENDSFEDPKQINVEIPDLFGDERAYWTVKISTPVQTMRQRWLFLAVGNCEQECTDLRFCASPVEIQYYLQMMNGESHFSADEDWNKSTFTFFLFVYLVLNVFAGRNRVYLEKLRKFHGSVLLLNVSVHLYLVYVVGAFVTNVYYESRGVRLQDMWVFSVIFSGLSEFCLLLHLILVAKGWTIVRRKISASGRVKIAVYMTAYVMIYIASVVYYAVYTDPGEVTYIYDTPPGLLLVLCRFAAFGWLQYSLYTTRRNYKGKRRFYQKYNLFASTWILTLPVFVLINRALDVWVRAKVMLLLNSCVSMVTHAVLLIMYNPRPFFGTFVVKSFPFHATTVAMLRNRKEGDLSKVQSNVGDIFSDFHVNRATELSQKVRQGLAVLQSYTSDLFAFLGEIKQGSSDPIADMEQGKNHPASSSQFVTNDKWASASTRNRGASDGNGNNGPSALLQSIPVNAVSSKPKSKPKGGNSSNPADRTTTRRGSQSFPSSNTVDGQNQNVAGRIDGHGTTSAGSTLTPAPATGASDTAGGSTRAEPSSAQEHRSTAARHHSRPENRAHAQQGSASVSRSSSARSRASSSSGNRAAHKKPYPARNAHDNGIDGGAGVLSKPDHESTVAPPAGAHRHVSSSSSSSSKDVHDSHAPSLLEGSQVHVPRRPLSSRSSSGRRPSAEDVAGTTANSATNPNRTPRRHTPDDKHRSARLSSKDSTAAEATPNRERRRPRRQSTPPVPDDDASAAPAAAVNGGGRPARRRHSSSAHHRGSTGSDGEASATPTPRAISTADPRAGAGAAAAASEEQQLGMMAPDPRARRPSTQSDSSSATNRTRATRQHRHNRAPSARSTRQARGGGNSGSDDSDDDMLLGRKL